MFKKINWTKVFYGFLWFLSLSGLVVLMSFIEVKKQELKCKKIQVRIPGVENFVEREEVNQMLRQGCGIIIGQNIQDINTQQIEDQIKKNPYIDLVKVYTNMDGVVQIEIKQREPVLRILNIANQDFYVDRDGFKMPISSKVTANVLVATGAIFENFAGKKEVLNTEMAKNIFKIAGIIQSDDFWNAQIQQIFVAQNNEIELVPTVGKQRILFGSADSVEIKMENLLAFYKNVIPKYGWDAYKSVNLKYTNQLVCEKNTVDSVHHKPSLPPIATIDSSNTIHKSNIVNVEKIAVKENVKKGKFVDNKMVNLASVHVEKKTGQVSKDDKVKKQGIQSKKESENSKNNTSNNKLNHKS